MNKIDWTKKLTSRKFWVAVAAFVVGVLAYFGKSTEETARVEGLIMAGATAIAYIIGEGLTDTAATKANSAATESDTNTDSEVESNEQ